MAKNKFYAVKKGKIPGIYESWEECEKNVKGFHDAQYKGFKSKEEAEEYMQCDDDQHKKDETDDSEKYEEIVQSCLEDKRIVAFTDGGFDNKNKIAGYGVYILEPDGLSHEINDIVRTDRFETSNNITPEIMAVITALDWAISHSYEKISIFHDYNGIGKWGKGEWKAKSKVAQWFVKKIRDYEDIIDIEYIWVKGHSGIRYNEEADRLATEAINKNIKPQFKMSESYFKCQNVGKQDVVDIIETMKKVPELEVNEKNDKSKIVFQLKYQKEKLTVNYFWKNTVTLVQGKPNSLFSLFVSYYTEKISDFNLVKAYSDMHKKSIKLSDVECQTNTLNLPSDFPDDIIKLIKQALSEKIALTKYSCDDAYDFSHYIFPACRALEGTIKYLFEINGEHLLETSLIGRNFEKDSSGLFVLKSQFHFTKYKDKLPNAYNVYYRNRHAIGHFGELLSSDGKLTTTMLVDDPKDAINIIDEILDTIKFD